MKMQKHSRIPAVLLAVMITFGIFPLSMLASDSIELPRPNSYYRMDEVFDGAILDHGANAHNMPITTNDSSVNVRPSYPGEIFENGYSPQKNYNYALHAGTTDYALHLNQSFSVSLWFKAQQDNTVIRCWQLTGPMTRRAQNGRFILERTAKCVFNGIKAEKRTKP